MSLASGVRTSVSEAYQNGIDITTASHDDLGLAANTDITGKYVLKVDAGSTTSGAIQATLKSVAPVVESIQGATLTLSPVTGGGSVQWRCKPDTSIATKYYPASCRD